MKEYKQALRTSETQREQLVKENEQLKHASMTATLPLGMTTPTKGLTTPSRPVTPDTPSKDVVLDQEPHGAEFEVCLVKGRYTYILKLIF